MLRWSLVGEFYSFCILAILFVRYSWHERDVVRNNRRKLFINCLLLSMSSIVVNIICVNTLAHTDVVPRWINMGLNTLYFLLSICMCSLFAYLLFDVTLEHVYDKHCLRRAEIMLAIATGISVLLLAVNLFTGILFYLDADGEYQRGVLNSVYYMLPVVELVFLFICFVRNRASVGDRMVYVMRSIPPLVLALVVLQLIFPNVLLNGTLAAIVALVYFLAFQSHTEDRDSVTSVSSRKAFMKELALRSAGGQAVQIIQISLLNISDINLQHGYAVGDALLYEAARFFRRSFSNGRVFRSGNATFSVMLPLESDEVANARVDMVKERFGKEWVLGEATCSSICCIAELRSSNLCGRPSEIVEKLEYTMSLAKEKRNVVRFDETVQMQLQKKTALIELLRRSIAEKRLQVWYQPLYCCHHDVFCSAEALLRLYDEDGNSVPPDVFIPLAEESGLIADLTWIVLDDICAQLSSGAVPLESISINLSMQQLLDPRLPRQIQERLAHHNVAPDRMRVEITERFVLHDAQYAQKQLTALQEIGVQIYMDDFGTGYSNLSSVIHYPFSFIKLDRSLVAPVPENRQAGLMIESLLKLFHDMGKRVVAEGVEQEEQAVYLRNCGVDMIQGYYYARPMPKEKLIAF